MSPDVSEPGCRGSCVGGRRLARGPARLHNLDNLRVVMRVLAVKDRGYTEAVLVLRAAGCEVSGR
jgi:hypothetical protein